MEDNLNVERKIYDFNSIDTAFIIGNGFNLRFIKDDYRNNYPDISFLPQQYRIFIREIIKIIIEYKPYSQLNSRGSNSDELLDVAFKRIQFFFYKKNNFDIESFSFMLETIFTDNRDSFKESEIYKKFIQLMKNLRVMFPLPPQHTENIKQIFKEMPWFWNIEPFLYESNVFDAEEEVIEAVTYLFIIRNMILNKMRVDFLQNFDLEAMTSDDVLIDGSENFLKDIGFFESRIITTNYDPYAMMAHSKVSYNEYKKSLLTKTNLQLMNEQMNGKGFGKLTKEYSHLHGSFLHLNSFFSKEIAYLLGPSIQLLSGNPTTSKMAATPNQFSMNFNTGIRTSGKYDIYKHHDHIKIFGLDLYKEYEIMLNLLESSGANNIIFYNTKDYFEENKEFYKKTKEIFLKSNKSFEFKLI